jgi:hypothetical protein
VGPLLHNLPPYLLLLLLFDALRSYAGFGAYQNIYKKTVIKM